jgi:hypothetical protein
MIIMIWLEAWFVLEWSKISKTNRDPYHDIVRGIVLGCDQGVGVSLLSCCDR